MDVDIPREVVVGKVGWELEKVLFLADLVRFLLVRGLGILLEVGIVPGLEPPADIDGMGVVYRCPHPGADVPVLDHSPFKQGNV